MADLSLQTLLHSFDRHEPPPVPPGWKPDPTRVWNSIQDENLRSSFNPQPLQSNLGPEQVSLLGRACSLLFVKHLVATALV